MLKLLLEVFQRARRICHPLNLLLYEVLLLGLGVYCQFLWRIWAHLGPLHLYGCVLLERQQQVAEILQKLKRRLQRLWVHAYLEADCAFQSPVGLLIHVCIQLHATFLLLLPRAYRYDSLKRNAFVIL